jgi:hypothetical protein
MSRGRDFNDAEGRASSGSIRQEHEQSTERTTSRGAEDTTEAHTHTPDRNRDRSEKTPHTTPQQVHRDRDQNYRLRESEVATLIEIAKFRTVRPEDLVEYKYEGDRERASADLRNLTAQGLIEKRTMHGRKPGQLLAVTSGGKRFVEHNERDGIHKDQKFHKGFVKPREARHDSALYRLYQKAAARIERDGGKNLRVVLDYELKKDLYRDLAKLKAVPSNEREERKEEIAEAHGLKVIDRKIPLPDLRIEYENRDGEQSREDLELATSDYRGGQLAEKARAGFSIYAPADEAGRVRAALKDPGLMTEILTL